MIYIPIHSLRFIEPPTHFSVFSCLFKSKFNLFVGIVENAADSQLRYNSRAAGDFLLTRNNLKNILNTM